MNAEEARQRANAANAKREKEAEDRAKARQAAQDAAYLDYKSANYSFVKAEIDSLIEKASNRGESATGISRSYKGEAGWEFRYRLFQEIGDALTKQGFHVEVKEINDWQKAHSIQISWGEE